jgi:peptide deformylase
MQKLSKSGRYGVGLAAPQVGRSLALSVITIRPTPSHPGRELFETAIINPTYSGSGDLEPLWEGCLSFGSNQSPVFAQAMRYKTIQASWFDEDGKLHDETLHGFIAHVFQHETDHLNGILFVDRVKDPKTWMNESEYKKLQNR